VTDDVLHKGLIRAK